MHNTKKEYYCPIYNLFVSFKNVKRSQFAESETNFFSQKEKKRKEKRKINKSSHDYVQRVDN